jgi:muramidase (phage lysozyme)
MLEGIQQAQAYRDKWNITTALGDAPTMLEEQGVFPQTSVEQPVGVTEESLDAGETPEKPSLMDRAISMFTPSEPEPDSVDTSKPEAGLMSPAEITTSVNDPTQALLERIAIGEGAKPELLKLQEKHGIGTTQYDMVYGFGDYVVPSKPVSEMTMKEVFDYQKELINATKGKVPGTNLGTSAVGKYQFVKTSLFGKGGTADKPGKNSWADKLNLKADTVFTPEIQEKLGMLVLKEAGYNSYIRGKKSEESFLNSIASKWASVEGSTANQHIATKKADLRPILADIKSLITTREDTNRETSPRPMLRPTE